LRNLLIFITAGGACGALALALELYRRVKAAEVFCVLNDHKKAAEVLLQSSSLQVLGLLALAIFFLGLLLLLRAVYRENEPAPPRPAESCALAQEARVTGLAAAAEEE